MTAHIGILPRSVIDTLTIQLNNKTDEPFPPSTRIWRLPHPRTGIASLFLPHEEVLEETGTSESRRKTTMLEIQSVSPPNSRSWFTGEEIIADGKMLLMTPVDPAFLILPILLASRPDDESAGRFQPLDDIFEEAATKLSRSTNATCSEEASPIPSEDDIVRLASLDCTKAAMSRICDVKEVTADITVYRFSQEKLLAYLRSKVERLSSPKVIEISRSITRGLAKDGLMEDGKEDALELARTKAACDLVSQYVPPRIYQILLSSYNFTALDAHIQAIKDEQDALISTTVNTGKSKKAVVDEEGTGKKRKTQVKTSHGVEKLKKVNVNGMAKLSTFFKKG